MKKTGTSVDIRTIKNFPSDNPNAKIVKDGLFLRVVEREYYWSKEKQRGLERRRYLGYIIDDVYYDTETYKKYFKRTGARRLVPMTDKTEVATPATFGFRSESCRRVSSLLRNCPTDRAFRGFD